jgi:hypothetical protein
VHAFLPWFAPLVRRMCEDGYLVLEEGAVLSRHPHMPALARTAIIIADVTCKVQDMYMPRDGKS